MLQPNQERPEEDDPLREEDEEDRAQTCSASGRPAARASWHSAEEPPQVERPSATAVPVISTRLTWVARLMTTA